MCVCVCECGEENAGRRVLYSTRESKEEVGCISLWSESSSMGMELSVNELWE